MNAMVTTWSSYGHRFYSGDDGYDSCMTCGAQYAIVPTPDETWDFKWTAADGSDPQECSYDTGRCHGYERYCHECDPNGDPCPHVSHDCNCVQCA